MSTKKEVDTSTMTPEQLAIFQQREARKKEEAAKKEAKRIQIEQKKAAAAAAAAKAKGGASEKPKKEGAAPKKEGPRLRNREFVNPTPAGEKKNLLQPLDLKESYDPAKVEASWAEWWEKSGFFQPQPKTPGEKFVIVIPPPNVTGSLHLGHALTMAIQDSLTRWHRMQGHETLWVPGTDHAGIATQVQVEKKLKKETGKSRHDIGREAFLEKVWEWKAEKGGHIQNQLRRMGISADWTREVFTMDEKLSKAVTEAFIRCYEKGLIYRSHRLVNWDVALQTAVSDIEVDYKAFEKKTKLRVPGYDREIDFGFIYEFAYKIEGSDGEIVVATTRPETMLGDTAVAVHSEDQRYKHLHGKSLIHPFVKDRKITVITDDKLVDMNFGTGAVKVTPAHDPNDYETGKRHNLEFINILNLDGTLNEHCGEFQGQKRFDARYNVMERLKELGLERGTKDNAMNIGLCSRSGDVIEPVILPQWWVDTTEMARRACDAVRSGELRLYPEDARDTWFRWLENVQPWCISRQLWWGHRCPAYRVSIDGKPATEEDWVVGRSEAEALDNAAKKYNLTKERLTVEQDNDVLDTWFSSGLFPFSVMGWPDNTEDMSRFYPTSLLETGKDILFFWVARMVMLGLTLTDKLPFTEVLLHSMVRDAWGRKMSKSTGNVIDPIDVMEGIELEDLHKQLLVGNLFPHEIEKAREGQKMMFPEGISECGADALRFSLCAYMSQGRDINLDINRVVSYRNFCNKIFQLTKFAQMSLGEDFKPAATADLHPAASALDRWMLHHVAVAIQRTHNGLKTYAFAEATTACYNLWLYDLADRYVEAIKPLFRAKDAAKPAQDAARQTLYTTLDIGLRLLHPFMPFVTEELWQRLPRRPGDATPSLMVAEWPAAPEAWFDLKAEADMELVKQIVHDVNSLRATYSIPSSKKTPLTLSLSSEADLERLRPFLGAVEVLSFSSGVELLMNHEPQPGQAIGVVNPTTQIHLSIKEYVNVEQELKKLEGKLTNNAKQIEALDKKMNIQDYASKVPAEVQAQNTAKRAALLEEQAQTEQAIEMFKKLAQ